jgi:hypothetical protein
MLRFASLASALFLACAATAAHAQESTLNAAERAELESGFRQAVEQIKPTLPRKLDDHTTLIDVSNEGVQMIYLHTLTLKLALADQDRLAGVLKQRVCGSEEMRRTLVWGATFNYKYEDANGNPVAAIQIANSDCATL